MARNFRRSGWQREHELHTAVSARSALSLLHGRANDLLTPSNRSLRHSTVLFRQGRSTSIVRYVQLSFLRKKKKKEKEEKERKDRNRFLKLC